MLFGDGVIEVIDRDVHNLIAHIFFSKESGLGVCYEKITSRALKR